MTLFSRFTSLTNQFERDCTRFIEISSFPMFNRVYFDSLYVCIGLEKITPFIHHYLKLIT
ncbi:hypothetical protein J2S17_005887 [Cytobacillus purgationiresistens]|uniref:Uncharacterized protein n=1 Tax=Cytobacillus purgationiresistens TaxID=863449 RepID=A0ABU0ARM2_9BACI|nr:hypothetical protein [Cytobacillus purgationiresistens]